MQLPEYHNLSTDKLGCIFKDTSATYKFYWFISILDLFVMKGKDKMVIWEIIAEMIGNAWYPIHYFHLSFGKQDSLDKQIREIRDYTNIAIDRNKNELVEEILQHPNQKAIRKMLRVFTHNVPFRFLRPWIDTSDDALMAKRSESFENNCLYSLERENGEWMITINPVWYDYLRKNYGILRDFAYWNLVNFIQARNPNVPNIPNKLIKPIERNSLTKQHRFWDVVIKAQRGINCIYTNKVLMPGDYALDHFIPWSFVTHDQIWNLMPADSSINSSKSDKLPDLDVYLMKLAEEHQKAISIIYHHNPSDKLLEDYCNIIERPADLIEMDKEHLRTVFGKTFYPLYQIASNMSFETWKYNSQL